MSKQRLVQASECVRITNTNPGTRTRCRRHMLRHQGLTAATRLTHKFDNPYATPNFQISHGYRGNSFNQQFNNYLGPSFQAHQGHRGNSFNHQPNLLQQFLAKTAKSGPNRSGNSGGYQNMWNQLHRNLNPNDPRNNSHGQARPPRSEWQCEQGEGPQNQRILGQGPPSRSERPPEENEDPN